MKLARILTADGQTAVALVEEEKVRVLPLEKHPGLASLADILHADAPARLVTKLAETSREIPLQNVRLLAPVDQQEIWAAGVTYRRSQVARMGESESGASHYDKVYTADRPELFFKATPSRVAGPGEPVPVRADSEWSVPEPEFTLVLNPRLEIVGYTIGNDMSARDIEGENPLYLPQAKVYRQCCALGPVVMLADEPLDLPGTRILLTIERGGQCVSRGETTLGELHRTFEELAGWLGREDDFPQGAMLLTGTGIVPEDDFTLQDGDEIAIEVTGIGTLRNPVVKASR